MTIGPSDEGDDAIANTGTACHIVPAADGRGARRRDPSFTPEMIKDISNGIYMCRDHGKLIDDDEIRFSAKMLRGWRDIAVLRAKIWQATRQEPQFGSTEFSKLPLIEEQLELKQGDDESNLVGTLLKDCATELIWGRDFAQSVRDMIVETAKNALHAERGAATKVTIAITPERIEVSDNGTRFDPLSLVNHPQGRGGKFAVTQLLKNYSGQVVLAHRYLEGHNRLTIARALRLETVNQVTECTINCVSRRPLRLKYSEEILETCSVIYVVLPVFWGPSDMFDFVGAVEGQLPKNKSLVFIANEVSASVAFELEQRFPGARVMRF